MGLSADEKRVIRDVRSRSFEDKKEFIDEFVRDMDEKEVIIFRNIMQRRLRSKRRQVGGTKEKPGADAGSGNIANSGNEPVKDPDTEMLNVKPAIDEAAAVKEEASVRDEDDWSD